MPRHRSASVCLAGAGIVCLASLAGGCAVRSEQSLGRLDEVARAGEPTHLRERRLDRLWAGRSRRDLQAVWGEPRLVMWLPAPREPRSLVLVYVGRDPSGGCIDAFVVLRDEAETIWTYICR